MMNRLINWFFRLDPAIMALIGFTILIGGAITLGLTIDSYSNGFSKSCKSLGGVPLIGRNDTKVCFKADVVLPVN